ncbi:MAG: MFS transporter [Verrucomicrobia bacterium]|nr:MFS transporter [Verrucomicrobiota bacterium]
MQLAPERSRVRGGEIIGYASGEGATSLAMNGVAAFAMLYYTQALGLPFAQAGIAFAVASLWDAIVDPAIGHLSDNTHSRWGRRHPYILVGGVLMAISFYFLWAVPSFASHGTRLFVYVLVMNMVMRTAYAVFAVPYVALGYEISNDYHQRTLIQGSRSAFNMLINICGPALGWTLFFPDKPGGPEATSVASNYLHMASAFTIAAIGFTFVVVLATRQHMFDTRGIVTGTGNTLAAYYRDFREIITDRYLLRITTFMCIGTTGGVFVATLQMYLYVYFMHLTAFQKTIIHGGGMVLYGLGGLLGVWLEKRVDKRNAVCIGAGVSAVADTTAAVVFLGKFLLPTTVWHIGGFTVPIAVIVFGGCDMFNWFGCGLFMSLAISMIADVAEVNELSSGVRKDGGYAAIYSFVSKLVLSISVFVASACLDWVGFVNGSDQQSPAAIRWLVLMTFGLGALFTGLVIPIARRYPITQEFMADVKLRLAARKGASA